MAEFNKVEDWLKSCPELDNLWSIAGEIKDYNKVVKISGTANLYQNASVKYVDGIAKVSGIPTDDYFETYTIQCFQGYVNQDDNYNLNAKDETDKICKWLIEQQNEIKLPIIGGEQIYFIECLTPKSIEQWVDRDMQIIAYYVSVRLHFKNPAKRVDYRI